MLYVNIEDLTRKVRLEVVENLVLSVLWYRAFINGHIEGISPIYKTAQPRRSKLIFIPANQGREYLCNKKFTSRIIDEEGT